MGERFLVLKVWLAFFCLFWAGSKGMAQEKPALALRDQLGREVCFERPVRRIVSLAPSATETVYALGAEDRLVGVTSFCNYPPEAQRKEKVGSYYLPSLEKIVALKPDLVVLSAPGQEQTQAKLEGLRLKVLVLNPQTSGEALESFRLLGKVLDLEARAESLVLQVRAQLDSVRAKAQAQADSPLVFVEIDSAPLFTCGGKSFLGELVRIAGGRNLFEDLPRDYAVVSAERVVTGKPDVILVVHPNAKARDVKERLGWGAIPAVKENRVYDGLDEDVLTRPGPRIGLTAEILWEKFNENTQK
jgi:iron complex transport system substrate-binding protein